MYKVSNSAISCLLRFMKYFIKLIGQAFKCDAATRASEFIPVTATTVYHNLLLDCSQSFIEYVVCPKCDCIYEFKDCYIQTGTNSRLSKTCCHIAFPDHPHMSRRTPCGALLLKRQKTKNGSKLVPIKAYPYRSLKNSILQMINRPNFLQRCEHWRERCNIIPDGYLGDIYDGDIWHKFTSSEANNFLKSPYSYLLTMNIDWFQPFTRSVYSTGAVYLTIQNLPRCERYKSKNVILVGVIPGPREPKLTTNSYLTPLVEELKEFWTGVLLPVTIAGRKMNISVRLALTCIACDIPASRKVSGFLGHSARLGCNKCLKEFTSVETDDGNTKVVFSGFDRDNWMLRSAKQHRDECKKLALEKTPTALSAAESNCGLRYSILLALPYFDPIKFTIIDPMHNLYLGTGKKAFKVWIKHHLLTDEALLKIETRAKNFIVPYDIGRLPANISSGYGGFTANQWCNWITIYSPVLLKEVLPSEHLRCWLLFVRACSITSSRILTVEQVNSADLFLVQFCKQFQNLYGPESCTPNLHMHTHLKDCILDYGPLHSFWCYAFERYNGILGAIQTNGKAVESQLMRRFLREQQLYNLHLPDDEDFLKLLPKASTSEQDNISFQSHCDSEDEVSRCFRLARVPIQSIASFALTSLVNPLPPAQEKVLSADLVRHLKILYSQLYPTRGIHQLPHFYEEYGRILLAGDMVGSAKPGANAECSSVIMAYWPGQGSSMQSIDSSIPRVGEIMYFIKHSVIFVNDDLTTETVEHLFCYVNWKQIHPHRDWYGVSAQVCSILNEVPDTCCIMPAQRIAYRCAHVKLSVEFPEYEETVYIACPIPLKYSL